MIDFSTPLVGMNAAAQSLNKTAGRIANVGRSPAGDTADLSAEAVAMIEARNNFSANVKAAQTEDQMTRALLTG